ncbi:Tetratricopeptide TPR-1 domain containing protein [Aphelenchoides bicaudatus]|nr:Tetratricopeptide TPR-1 domain containing protein [Aphelenchoides bicaudatus]
MDSGDSASTSVKMSEEERNQLAEKLDRELDEFMDALAERSKSNNEPKEPFNFDKFCAELDQHPAFMRDLNSTENGQYSEAIQALQALKYDESADDDADMARTEGNKHFKFKKYRWARDAYTNGIKAKSKDPVLNSVLYANRAAAQKHLGNLKSAIRDCIFALKFNQRNWKAALCGTKCLYELGYMQRCLDWNEWFDRQLNKEELTNDEYYRKFSADMDLIVEKAKKGVVAEERNERRRRAEARKIEEEKRLLLTALQKRNLRFTPPLDLSNMEEFDLADLFIRSPYTKEQLQERVYWDSKANDDGTGALVWPLLLVYISAGQTDMIKDCNENTPLIDLLSPVLSDLPWDQKSEYNFQNIRFFVPLDVFDERQIEEISLRKSLHTVLSIKDHYIQKGLPMIHIYTADKVKTDLEKVSGNRYRVL